MTGAPPVLSSDQQGRRDAEHLKLLSIFYFIMAGFGVVVLGFIALHFVFMRAFLTNPDFRKTQNTGPASALAMDIMIWAYAFALVVILIGTTLNLLSAIFIRQRRHRLFSLVVAALNCLHVPLGTILGVFTVNVLSRDSVRRLYESSGAASRPA